MVRDKERDNRVRRERYANDKEYRDLVKNRAKEQAKSPKQKERNRIRQNRIQTLDIERDYRHNDMFVKGNRDSLPYDYIIDNSLVDGKDKVGLEKLVQNLLYKNLYSRNIDILIDYFGLFGNPQVSLKNEEFWSNKYNITTQRVKEIINSALNKLRSFLHKDSKDRFELYQNLNEDNIDNIVKRCINEAIRGGFSFGYLKTLRTYSERVKYCNMYLGNNIGSGSGRIVFQLDDNKILKLAKNMKGIAQNEKEGQRDWYRDGYGIFPEVYYELSDEDNYTFLVSEYVLPANEKDFNVCLGLTSREFYGFLLQSMEAYSRNRIRMGCYPRFSEARFRELIENNEELEKWYSYMCDYGVTVLDLGNRNFGMALRDGEPTIVMLDNGFDEEIQKKYYSRRMNESILDELEVYHGGPVGIKKFVLYGDNIKIRSRLMGTGVYVTLDKKEANSYSRGHVYTLEIPEDDGSNYLDFTSPLSDELLEKIVNRMNGIIPSEDIINRGRISLGSLLGVFRMFYAKNNPGEPNHKGDMILNKILLENGIIGHKVGTTYVIYNPDDIKIIK